ncbi:MAG TPA: primosomal protein N' [Patescibacteria group bacterium]|nr:primosomal protein N' [Patescibacteria group bacterium]
MRAKIVLPRRMPRSLPYLDYLVPKNLTEKIEVGQLVLVPFRRQTVFGVVFSLENGKSSVPEKKLKEIQEIVITAPLLSNPELKFLEEISAFYATSLGFILKSNLLPLKKRKLKDLTLQTFTKPKPKKREFSAPLLQLYQSPTEKQSFLSALKKTTGQILILVPNVRNVEELYTLLPQTLQPECLQFSSETSDKDFFEAWVKLWREEKRIVIGTRRALFLPWKNLETIVMDNEANPDYKSWDMAPRLHTKDACLLLARQHGSQLTFLAFTPSVDTYYFAKQKVYRSNGLEIGKGQGLPEIVDFRNERKMGNYGFLSEELKKALDKKPQNVFVFLNRKGSFNYVGCRDCGYVERCETCRRTLSYHQKENQLVCNYCHLVKPMTTLCPSCSSMNVAMYGVGTELAENTLQKDYGKNYAIFRLDSENPEENEKYLSQAGPKIIIGTQIAWDVIKWNKIDLLVFLDADTPLFVPEYKTNENLWFLIRDAIFRLNPGASFILQTSHPDHMVFRSIYAPGAFYEEELKNRSSLDYPPVSYLVRLFYGAKTAPESEREALRLTTKLNTLTKDLKGLKILGPLPMYPVYQDLQYWQVIIAKIPYSNYKKYTKLLAEHTPDTWKFDPNPNTLLTKD